MKTEKSNVPTLQEQRAFVERTIDQLTQLGKDLSYYFPLMHDPERSRLCLDQSAREMVDYYAEFFSMFARLWGDSYYYEMNLPDAKK